MIGQKIGSYEVLAKLGEGGMGEVYRARDSKLDRDVALKILPESFAGDPDRRMRFEREARTLASLNHPNIAQIYGFEDSALVMELVEGPTLQELIGTLKLDETLALARQVADALEAAHEAGIIHRDLKPANLKVRPDGTVKVLDFGLAKAADSGPAGSNSGPGTRDSGLTVTSPAMTAMGLILGTAAYMSPEQAKGRPVDRRADIWAFGVVLYEMVTGRRLFDAEDVSETLAAVLTRDVSVTAMPATIPSGLRALIGDCLVRDPRKRLRDIGDARLRIERLEAGGVDAGPDTGASAIAASGGRRWLWPAFAVVSTLVALATTWLYLNLNRAAPPPADPVAFDLSAPGIMSAMTVSPDGRHLAYVVLNSETRNRQLWLRSLGSAESRAIPGTDFGGLGIGIVAQSSAWSPDSRSVVFGTPSSLRRVDVATGQSSEIAALPNEVKVAGAWSRDGVILFGRRSVIEASHGGIWRIADTGGPIAQVVKNSGTELWQRPSGFLPDGRRFLYTVYPRGQGQGSAETRIGSLDRTPEEQDSSTIVTADGPAVYAPAVDAFGNPGSAGYLLFVRRGSLLAQPFDPASASFLDTAPIQIASGAGPTVHASQNGRLVYRVGTEEEVQQSELVRVDRKGTLLGKIGPAATYGDINVFADGLRLAVVRTDANEPQHLFVVDMARGVFSRLSPGAQADYASAIGADSTVAYTFSPDGLSRDIYARPGNGVGDPRLLVKSDTVKHPNSWSPDGRYLIFDDHVPGRNQDLLVVRADGGAPIPFLATDADETVAQFSPDGQWIAYKTTEAGRSEVFVRDFAPDRSPAYGSERVQISVTGGDKPRWSRSGNEIYFLQGTMLMAAPVTSRRPFTVGRPVPLFETRITGFLPYAVMPDGTFVLNMVIDGRRLVPAPLRVLLNWQSSLKK